jgi:hypothetical protein
MSAPSPPPATKAPPGPLAPPDEKFWERYSPHYEFPLSSVGSVAMHIAALVLFLGALYLLSRMTISDKTAVPMRAVAVAGEGDGPDGQGAGGGAPQEDINLQRPEDRAIPEANLRETVDQIKDVLPKIEVGEGLRPEDLPTVRSISSLSDDLRRKLLQGSSGKRGSGPGDGTGTSGAPGQGSGANGDPTSSASRAVRWELVFRTESGKDYLDQLAAMKATLVIPQPSDWKNLMVYRNIAAGRPTAEPFRRDQLPGLYFVDDDKSSAHKLAEALGLDFQPPMFVAFFPKDIEDELARKEREYRGRQEGEIFSTTFKIVVRDGRPTITVTEQKPVRR